MELKVEDKVFITIARTPMPYSEAAGLREPMFLWVFQLNTGSCLLLILCGNDAVHGFISCYITFRFTRQRLQQFCTRLQSVHPSFTQLKSEDKLHITTSQILPCCDVRHDLGWSKASYSLHPVHRHLILARALPGVRFLRTTLGPTSIFSIRSFIAAQLRILPRICKMSLTWNVLLQSNHWHWCQGAATTSRRGQARRRQWRWLIVNEFSLLFPRNNIKNKNGRDGLCSNTEMITNQTIS